MNRRRLVMPAVTVAVLSISAGLGWGYGAGRLDGDRAALDDRLDLYRRVLTEVRSEREARPELDARLGTIIDRTLGADLESVDSTLRRRLVDALAADGLRGGVVNTMGTAVVGTPATRAFRRNGPERALRDEPDFVRVGASVSGTGTFGEVVRFVHRLDAAPWVKRIEQVRLDPDRTGGRVTVAVRLSTIFVPGSEPDPEAAVTPRGGHELGRYAALVAANPFRHRTEPPPIRPPVAVVEVVETTVTPTIDPWSTWLLTGVVQGGPGNEAWCRQPSSGRSATLLPEIEVDLGDGLLATLVSIDGEVAVLRLGDETRRIVVGSTLGRSRP